jgi:hypothetical protein
LAVQGGLACGVALLLPPFAGFLQLAVAGGEDLLLPFLKPVLGGDVADGGVQANGVVVLDEVGWTSP